MIGYLFVFLAVTLQCGMTVVRKEFQKRADATIITTITFMLINCAFICMIGVIYGAFTEFQVIKAINWQVFVLAIVFAVVLTVNTMLCIFGAKYGSLAMITMFATLGTIVISTIYGLISDPERNKLSVWNILGIVIVLIIIFIGYFFNHTDESSNQNDTKNRKLFALICLGVFILNGSALSIYSRFTSTNKDYGEINYIFLYSSFCVVLCLIPLLVFILIKKGKVPEITASVRRTPLLLTILYGGLFMFSELFSLLNTSVLPIVIQAPLSFAFDVVAIAILDFVLYKQKLSKVQIIQIMLSILSGVLFAL